MLVKILRYLSVLPEVYLAFVALSAIKLLMFLPFWVLISIVSLPLLFIEKVGGWRISLIYFSIYIGILSLRGNVLFGNALSNIVLQNPYLSWSYSSIFVVSGVVCLYLDSLVREEKIYSSFGFPKEDVEEALNESLTLLVLIITFSTLLTIGGYILVKSLWGYLLRVMKGEPYYIVPLIIFVLGASTILLFYSEVKISEVVAKVRLRLGSSFKVRRIAENDGLIFELYSEGSVATREIILTTLVENDPGKVTVKSTNVEKNLKRVEMLRRTAIYSDSDGVEI